MRIRSTLLLTLALCSVAGCTSTMTFDLSESSDREAAAEMKSVKIELHDGNRFKASDLEVLGDSLFFEYVEPGRRLGVPLSDIAKVSATKAKPAQTVLLIIATPVVLIGAAFLIGCSGGSCGD